MERPKESGPIAGLLIAGGIVWMVFFLFFSKLDFPIQILLVLVVLSIHIILALSIVFMKNWAIRISKLLSIASFVVGLIMLSPAILIIYGLLIWLLSKPNVKGTLKQA
jgi:hypothetical protein